jgi:alkyldihydroxyacetonephosphate synthase
MYTAKHMKWWGWGDEDVGFDAGAHPGLWPYAKAVLGVEEEKVNMPPVSIDAVRLREAIRHEGCLAELRLWMRADQICDSRHERLVHAYGKGLRDLFRMRHGMAEGAPDLVVYPENEHDVLMTVRAAAEHDVVIIPFGGGSNIAGCLERSETHRMVMSLDMRRMRRVLAVDKESLTARIEAGVFGPDLEEQLSGYGLTLGHFPDSFLHSTLGGWIATRSAGMQSDKYGKIEDMVIALRMVTPAGVLATRTVPKSSNGIDVNHLCIGSEGTLGVITEATMQVHPRAESRRTHGYLFPDFESGIEAMHECVRKQCTPSMSRMNDSGKTALSMAFKPPSSKLSQAMTRVMKGYLQMKGFDFARACLMLTTFEGSKADVTRQHHLVSAIHRRLGAADLGLSSGKSFESTKYDFPHIRDFLMDRGITSDVSETATVWSNVVPLYRAATTDLSTAIEESGVKPWVGCHISHSYHSGASLYLTFACQQKHGQEMQQYLQAKRVVQQSFIDHGATLSHHHAVGTEHLPWLSDDISPVGVLAIAAIKGGLDPGNVMNPGRLRPSIAPLEEWLRVGGEAAVLTATRK